MGQSMNESWDAYLASLTDLAWANDTITDLGKEREPGIALPYLGLLPVYILTLFAGLARNTEY